LLDDARSTWLLLASGLMQLRELGTAFFEKV